MTKALTKTLAATLTALVISTSFASSASASDRGFTVNPVKQQKSFKGGNQVGKGAAIGLALGIGGAVLGAAIANAQPRGYGESRYQEEPRYRPHGHGFRPVSNYQADDEEECFQKPIRRFDPYSGRVVTVGTREVCR